MCCAWLWKRSKSGAPEFGKGPSSKGRAADPSKIQGTQLEPSCRSPIYLVMHFPVMHQQHALLGPLMKRVGVVTETPRRELQKQRRHGAERQQMLIRCNLRGNEPPTCVRATGRRLRQHPMVVLPPASPLPCIASRPTNHGANPRSMKRSSGYPPDAIYASQGLHVAAEFHEACSLTACCNKRQ